MDKEHFTIDSIKAAEILGVNRTRLSQLTSKGLFPYERRKVESRSRLFYRLNDLLTYQRKSSFGNLPTQTEHCDQNSNTIIPLLPPGHSQFSVLTPLPVQKIQNSAKVRPHRQIQPKRILKSALEIKASQKEKTQLEYLTQKVHVLEIQLNKISELLKISETLLQNHTRSLNIKKAFLKRPRVKRTFKRIKR